jgi:hypothetical protein
MEDSCPGPMLPAGVPGAPGWVSGLTPTASSDGSEAGNFVVVCFVLVLPGLTDGWVAGAPPAQANELIKKTVAVQKLNLIVTSSRKTQEVIKCQY